MDGLGSGGPKGAAARRPRAVICYICGRQYGTSSIEIHLKACKKRFLEEESQKPKHLRRPLPEPPKEIEPRDGMTEDDVLEAKNEIAFRTFNDTALVRCEHCGRTFLPDRLVIHQRACTAEHPAKPVGEVRPRGLGRGGGGAIYTGPEEGEEGEGAGVGRGPASPELARPKTAASSTPSRPRGLRGPPFGGAAGATTSGGRSGGRGGAGADRRVFDGGDDEEGAEDGVPAHTTPLPSLRGGGGAAGGGGGGGAGSARRASGGRGRPEEDGDTAEDAKPSRGRAVEAVPSPPSEGESSSLASAFRGRRLGARAHGGPAAGGGPAMGGGLGGGRAPSDVSSIAGALEARLEGMERAMHSLEKEMSATRSLLDALRSLGGGGGGGGGGEAAVERWEAGDGGGGSGGGGGDGGGRRGTRRSLLGEDAGGAAFREGEGRATPVGGPGSARSPPLA